MKKLLGLFLCLLLMLALTACTQQPDLNSIVTPTAVVEDAPIEAPLVEAPTMAPDGDING